MDGGLAGFRYVYEHGLNMLLYDCGGATTDIALVRAKVEGDRQTLRITVLRRSGVRTFGGGDITRQVCRLLKAKIAHALAIDRKMPHLPTPPTFQEKPPKKDKEWRKLGSGLEYFIQELAALDPQDRLVPTRTLKGKSRPRTVSRPPWPCRDMGEKLKLSLASDKPPEDAVSGNLVAGLVRLPPLKHDTNSLTRAIFPTNTEQVSKFKRKLEAITITRTEIDALIYDPVMRSINNCNQLIRSVFNDADNGEVRQEVHWVVASGKAVCYPFLQSLLRQHLAVAFLADDTGYTSAPVNAKEGTVEAQKRETQTFAVRLRSGKRQGCHGQGGGAGLGGDGGPRRSNQPAVRQRFGRRLPFDVGYRDLTTNQVQNLYREYTYYQALKALDPIPIPVAKAAVREESARFQLLRIPRRP